LIIDPMKVLLCDFIAKKLKKFFGQFKAHDDWISVQR
jgi:hypothetical protein